MIVTDCFPLGDIVNTNEKKKIQQILNLQKNNWYRKKTKTGVTIHFFDISLNSKGNNTPNLKEMCIEGTN